MAPEPVLVLHMEPGTILNAADLPNTPGWAKPVVAAALKLGMGGARVQVAAAC